MISYIIVSYNTTQYTQNTILSILNCCKDFEIIVVDNNSSDSTVHDINTNFSNYIGSIIKVIPCQNNNGFSKANNIGAKLAQGDYFVFINPDTVVLSDIGNELRLIYETKFKSKQVILSPQILNPDYTLQHCLNLFPIINISTFFKKIKKQLTSKSRTEYIGSDWITGVCFCVSKETFQNLSGWNEMYDLYSEDLDFCYRLKKYLSGQVILCKNIKLIHYGNQSGKLVYKSTYSQFKKKMDSLKKFYLTYYNEKKFIKYLGKLKFFNKSEDLIRYYNEQKHISNNG